MTETTGGVRKAKPEAVDEHPPITRELAGLLGRSHAAFLALTRPAAGVTCEWKRYGRRSPWVLKVSQDGRTLFYATPKAGAFEATVVLGGRAEEAALRGRVSARLHASIRAAKPYVEGRPVRVIVRGQADLAGVEQLIAVKLDPTGGRGRSRPGMAQARPRTSRRNAGQRS